MSRVHEAVRELGRQMGTNFERCSKCRVSLRPLQANEVQFGFDLEPFPSPEVEERIMGALLEAFRSYQEKGNICIHHPRVWIRVTTEERVVLGRALQEKGAVLQSARISILADMLLEEGAFHPSRLQPVNLEDLL